ncbi:OmpA family protein [Blattabacterium cuenoti]|uniref:OmpA family protein n=1 Tax=Blattabacterium cuenoti TaxID=1653831 RepID=UPI00163D316A|nr:OmpA family protein [Blattabacterium cuenoti]
MKNVNFFIITLFTLFSSVVYSQYYKKKWSIRIRAHDINYYPTNDPFKDFFHQTNNNINPFFSDVELEFNLNKHLGVYLNPSLGMVDNSRWTLKDNFFLKLDHGVNFYLFPKYWLDPYLKLGGGYHKFNYKNKILKLTGLNFFKLEKKNFFLLDGGLGMNVWIVPNFGINIQSNYNHIVTSLKNLDAQDYLNFWQHTLGVIFRFNIKKTKNLFKKPKKITEIYPKNYSFPSEKTWEKNKNEKNKKEKEDFDNDGIVDKEDLCPDKFGKKENNGCPNIVVVFPPILFNVGKFTLSSISLEIINKISEIMIKKIPYAKFYITGYTDYHGKSSYNKILSIRRAQTVFKALVSKGVDPYRMEIRGGKKNQKRFVKITIKK